MSDFWVNGIVSNRDQQPYVQLSNEKGMIAQLTMAQARIIAMDILIMASRTECDAMVVKFFSEMNLPREAAGHMLVQFRDFRAQLDQEKLERKLDEPQGEDPA
jgi:hypothetical protein